MARGSAVAALILLSPVAAFLMVIAAEMLIDLLIEAPALLAVIASGVIGWPLFHRLRPRPEGTPQSGLEPSLKEPAPIAAPGVMAPTTASLDPTLVIERL